MKTATQLNVTIPNTPGSLATLTDKLRAAEVNINAICATEGKAHNIVHLIVDDPDTAKIALQPQYRVTVDTPICFTMKNNPGAIASISRACAAADVNIRNIYATTTGKGKDAAVYLLLSDSERTQHFLTTWEKKFKSIA